MLNIIQLPQRGNVKNIVRSAMHRKASEESALKGRNPQRSVDIFSLDKHIRSFSD